MTNISREEAYSYIINRFCFCPHQSTLNDKRMSAFEYVLNTTRSGISGTVPDRNALRYIRHKIMLNIGRDRKFLGNTHDSLQTFFVREFYYGVYD